MTNKSKSLPAKTDAVTASPIAWFGEQTGIADKQAAMVLLKTIFPGFDEVEIARAVMLCRDYGLNPNTKQLYLVKMNGKVEPVVGIDGWLAMAHSHPNYAAHDYQTIFDDKGNVAAVTCTILKKDGTTMEWTESLKECKRNTDPWNNQPSRMLRHRAFIQCCRQCFGFAVHDPEDAARAQEIEISASSYTKPEESGTKGLKASLGLTEEEHEAVVVEDNGIHVVQENGDDNLDPKILAPGELEM